MFLAAYQDRGIQRWHTRRPASEDQVREWFDGYRRAWAREKAGHWAVTRDGGEVLGRIALSGMDFDDGIAECAYWVRRVAAKSGFVLEGTKRSAAVHDDGRHDMHLHARIRGEK